MIQFEYGKSTPAAEMRPNTIYLDGAVQGPIIDNDRRSYSFDHHGGCVRAFTLATCQQVAIALELGLDPEGLDVVINDIDADTVLAVWLLQNRLDRIDCADLDDLFDAKDRLDELVERIGFVDSHGPAVPGHPPHPLHAALTPRFGEAQSLAMLEEYLQQVDRYIETGAAPEARAPQRAPAFGLRDGKLVDLGMVSGFQDVYGAGCPVGIVCVPGADGTTGYTVGKVSDFVQYDIGAFLARCNELEPGWGGGSTIGGAPRLEGRRSSLTREQVEHLLEV